MKKILIAVLAVVTMFTACKKYNDQFDGLDDLSKPSNLVAYSYTLTDADYKTISDAALKVATNAEDSAKAYSINTNKFFSVAVPMADYAAFLLDKMYKAGDWGSSTRLTFNNGQNSPPFSILNKADYQYAWESTTYFVYSLTPLTAPDIKMDAILKNKFPDAIDGELKYIEYNYSEDEPVTGLLEFIYFGDDFEGHTNATYTNISENGWIQKDLVGNSELFELRSYSSNKYAQMSSNGGPAEANEVYFIHEVDLTDGIAPQFSFDVNVGYWNAVVLQVLVSEDFDGNTDHISTANWTDITSDFTIPVVPTSGYGTFAAAGTSDLTAYADKKIYIAFKYSGDDSPTADPLATTTIQVDNVKISEVKEGSIVPASEKKYLAYNFDGTDWINLSSETFYVLQQADYDAMGISSVSTSDLDNYVAVFLKNLYPYAQEGDAENVVYESSAGPTNAMQFIFSNGAWSSTAFQEEKTEQYIFNGTTWVFDPTVTFTMQKSDYQILVDHIAATESQYLDNSHPENTEWYYGASAYYGNFDLQLANRQLNDPTHFPADMTAEAGAALMDERLIEGLNVLLQAKYPDAVPTVNGVDVYYIVNYDVYYGNSVRGKLYIKYQCTGNGAFTYVEGPIEL